MQKFSIYHLANLEVCSYKSLHAFVCSLQSLVGIGVEQNLGYIAA